MVAFQGRNPIRARLLCTVLAVLVGCIWTPIHVITQPALGYFESSGDVGDPAIPGSSTYDPATQTYTITGSGTNMWATRDEFQFTWRRMNGDFLVRTHARFLGA